MVIMSYLFMLHLVLRSLVYSFHYLKRFFFMFSFQVMFILELVLGALMEFGFLESHEFFSAVFATAAIGRIKVTFFMVTTVAVGCKSFLTDSTFVRSISCMHSYMIYKASFIVKYFLAILKWTLVDLWVMNIILNFFISFKPLLLRHSFPNQRRLIVIMNFLDLTGYNIRKLSVNELVDLHSITNYFIGITITFTKYLGWLVIHCLTVLNFEADQ